MQDHPIIEHPDDVLSRQIAEEAQKAYQAVWDINPEAALLKKKNITITAEAQAMIDDFSRNENSVKAIIDQEDFVVHYVSDNLKDIFGYSKETWMKYNMLLFFKSLTVRHLTFPIKATMWNYKNTAHLPIEDKQNQKLIFCGIKAKDSNRRVRTLLIRYLPLSFNEIGVVKTAIVSLEDVSHLIKSDFYWVRTVCGKQNDIITHYFSDDKKYTGDDIISDREKDVLRLIAKGMESKEIGNELFISPNTVDNHRKNMIARTGARDTTALLQLCISCGII